MNEQEMRRELERAWRAIQGFWTAAKNGQVPDATMLAYHAPTIAGAVRFVQEGASDGSNYFIGRHVDDLRAVLK